MAKVIDGKEVASEIRRGLAEKIQRLKEGGVTPGLAVIFGRINITNLCTQQGKGHVRNWDDYHTECLRTSQNELLGLISKLNDDPGVHGM